MKATGYIQIKPDPKFTVLKIEYPKGKGDRTTPRVKVEYLGQAQWLEEDDSMSTTLNIDLY